MVDRVAALLQPWLGRALLDITDVCEDAAQLLKEFDVMHGDYADLAKQVRATLIRHVYRITKGSFVVFRDDGRQVKLYMDDFSVMADALLYIVFRSLVHSAWNCSRVREYALSHDSLSALRALYVDFAQFQTNDEKAMLAYTVRTCHPEYRWRRWLQDDEISKEQ